MALNYSVCMRAQVLCMYTCLSVWQKDISSMEMCPAQSIYVPLCSWSPSHPPSFRAFLSPSHHITHSMKSISEFGCNPRNLSGSFTLNQSRELYSSVRVISSIAQLKRKIINFINICCFHITKVINNDYWPQSIGYQTCICISHHGWEGLPGLPQFKSTVIILSSCTGLL